MDDGPWTCLSAARPYRSRVFDVCQDRIRLQDGTERQMAFVDSRGAVYVVPVTDNGQIVLIEQYRHPVRSWLWEVPAGGLFDHHGSMESLAQRELLEEAGGVAGRFEDAGWFYDAAPISNSRCHVMVAFGTRLSEPPRHGASEVIRVHTVGVDDALNRARDGRMMDGRSALALLRSEPRLRNYSR